MRWTSGKVVKSTWYYIGQFKLKNNTRVGAGGIVIPQHGGGFYAAYWLKGDKVDTERGEFPTLEEAKAWVESNLET